ncbi:MAG TPA: SDR family NAD(P)-dependent oxidoreductase [Spirochaetota bacterium]|nr:SDR family NAD(P)-dependent oxidoreductase [Spirochaetota bacterium]HPC43323.1 SDR family NAD(P)-dependent oxidoreductase [Spirochaetota bacterium]HQF10188.1 SDR family NAD(P)-dependent oxidoreductase [Spirochaetota bacterium]HQH99379.1 SDR family NAD(P)-dependent oxidoreductase [Spirochaetota bacterium]HQJ73113.1 SDR family NAD(P)-dependent oxidoreductase [Spirochaetota bacterium]
MKLEGKVVLITGASTGIGREAAIEFNRAGARVAIAARRKELLDELASHLRDPLVLKTDLADEKQARAMVDKTVKHFGRIDILINNAATSIVESSDRISRDDLLRAFTVNLLGPVSASQQAFVHMKKQGGGHMINVGTPGFMIGVPFYTPYACSKAAFSAWTRTVQGEWADAGITVSEYFPGYTETGAVAESAYGPIPMDLVMNRGKGFLARYFSGARNGNDVARDLVKLAKKPRHLMFSTFMERLAGFVANIPAIRIPVVKRMAATARKKMEGRHV